MCGSGVHTVPAFARLLGLERGMRNVIRAYVNMFSNVFLVPYLLIPASNLPVFPGARGARNRAKASPSEGCTTYSAVRACVSGLQERGREAGADTSRWARGMLWGRHVEGGGLCLSTCSTCCWLGT